ADHPDVDVVAVLATAAVPDVEVLVKRPGQDLADQVDQPEALRPLNLPAEHVGEHEGSAPRMLSKSRRASVHRQRDAYRPRRSVDVEKARQLEGVARTRQGRRVQRTAILVEVDEAEQEKTGIARILAHRLAEPLCEGELARSGLVLPIERTRDEHGETVDIVDLEGLRR